jgi:hypothetical protein
MGKLTGRTAISTNIDENLLIHVVDTTGTPASYKATLSQLYGVFPKNSSAGASDVNYLARWTAADELGKGIVQDNGSQATINGKTIVKNSGVTSQLELHKTGGSLIYFYDDAGTAIQSYVGDATVSTSADTFRIFHQGAIAVDINSSQNVDIKETIQIRQTSGTAPVAGQYLKAINAQGEAEWADVVGGVQVSGTPNNNEIAVWTNSDTIEGDSNLTWNGSTFEVTSGNNESRILADYLYNLNESDDANLLLYTKSAGTSIGSEIIFGRWNGTIGSESPLIDAQLISAQRIMGSYDSANPTNITTGALIETRAAGAWTTSNYGVVYTIDTATEGTTTVSERFRIDSDGSGKFTSQVYSSIASTVTPSAGAATIDWNNGNMQVLDLQTGGNITTFTINNPKAGASYFIKIIQGGSNTITWPAAVKWAENDEYAGSVGAGDIDAVALTYDGTNYLANYSLDYQ